MQHLKKTHRTLGCSFCGKQQDQVEQLIAGPGGVYICDQCIDLCNQIIQENRAKRQQASEPPKT